MPRRLSYIDTTRAILITMVVLGHILNYANPGYDIIPYTLAQAFMNSFHMPAFFLLSGMLNDGKAKIGENALTIMGTHQLVLYTIPGNSRPLWVLGMFCLIAAVEAVLILTINRFCPVLVGKRRKETSNVRNETANGT